MKLTTFLGRLFVSSALFLAATTALACGPYDPVIPQPKFFGLSQPAKTTSAYFREENLKAWQKLTSPNIPLPDIEAAVYDHPLEWFNEAFRQRYNLGANMFYDYLRDKGHNELKDFLQTAKEIDHVLEVTKSPWYYPASRDRGKILDDFSGIINYCDSYEGHLKDRYNLQTVKVLFFSRQYERCIARRDSLFGAASDNNLMKRMADRYAAGCWKRLGYNAKADSIFAAVGDVWSLSCEDPAIYMAANNPAAPQLMDYLRSKASDTALMLKMQPVAERMLKDRRVSAKADWEFLLAYINNEFLDNRQLARRYIYSAIRHRFSSKEIADGARSYKIKLDAYKPQKKQLLADLQWLYRKCENGGENAVLWAERIRNIIYVDWIPNLWQQKDYATAILLCAFADRFESDAQDVLFIDSAESDIFDPCSDYMETNDYSCLSFQLMGSLSSAELESAYRSIRSDNPLYRYLRLFARTDNDYFYELIGTLAIREQNYNRAIKFLSRVSSQYLSSMNIRGYLNRDAFAHYPTRWSDEPGEYAMEQEHQAAVHSEKASSDNAKLTFAYRMKRYKDILGSSADADERGIARMMYAIGLRNSFEECWALTQYWRGENVGLFRPYRGPYDTDFAAESYSFLYNYMYSGQHKAIEQEYNREIAAAIRMMKSDEARAHAHYILHNLKTIIKHYPDTTTGIMLRTSCDNWHSWI